MLLEKLIAKQQDMRMGDRDFAKELRISRPLWYKTRTDRKPVGMKLIAGTIKRFPELIPEAIFFFQNY